MYRLEDGTFVLYLLGFIDNAVYQNNSENTLLFKNWKFFRPQANRNEEVPIQLNPLGLFPIFVSLEAFNALWNLKRWNKSGSQLVLNYKCKILLNISANLHSLLGREFEVKGIYLRYLSISMKPIIPGNL